jgi:hypothetical protein
MRSFYYRPGRSAFTALFAGSLALGAGKLWYDKGGWVLLASAAFMAVGAAKAAFDAMSGEPALKFDTKAIWIRKTWGGVEEVPWRDVHAITGKVFTVRYMGIIPIRRTTFISVTCEGGIFGARRLRVSTTAMGLSVSGSADLVLLLKQAHLEAVGEAGVAMAGAGSRGWGVGPSDEPAPSSGFDPDAAVARYLASKQAPAQDQPDRGLAPARPPMPQRPVFGRRAG